jgi:hypothetical protein
MRDDLAAVPAVITLSRSARRVVTANLVIAAVIIAALVTWDLAGHLPLPLGVLGHEGSTVIVGLNGLRLLRKSAWTRAMNALATLARSCAPGGPSACPSVPSPGRAGFSGCAGGAGGDRHYLATGTAKLRPNGPG